VILFGSAARGELTRDSDLDFLVIEPEVENPALESVRLRRVLADVLVPMDIIVASEHRVQDGGPPARQCSPSQREDQLADGGGLGEEGVVAGVEFHDAARPTGERALQLGGGALVLCADEVRRGHVLPGR
jgi:hypothetical protein